MSKILIIEDEMPIAELEKDYLELSDFEVVIENEGTHGMDLALRGDFDLVILDVMLPGDDGLTLCRNVRARMSTPILMLTARGDEMDRIIGGESLTPPAPSPRGSAGAL